MPTRQQHPLQSNVAYRPGDTSVDTSRNVVQDEADLSEPHEVEAVFGEIGLDTQGPAGVPIPENSQPAPKDLDEVVGVADMDYGYSEDPEAPEDAVGPVPLVGHLGSFTVEELMSRDGAAEAAVLAAGQFERRGTVEMLDAMEDAEAQFLMAHPPPSSEDDEGEEAATGHAKKALEQTVDVALRDKVVQKIAVALASNPQFVGSSTDAAQQCEKALFDSSRSATGYQNVAANAIRVATQAADLGEVLRVSRGEPRPGIA